MRRNEPKSLRSASAFRRTTAAVAKTADFEFHPAQGGWNLCDFQVANEEAGHAVACAAVDVEILEVRIDRPDESMGICATIPGLDVAGFRRQLFCTLAGPLTAGREIPWPPNIDDAGVEGVCARLVYLLGLNREGWLKVTAVVREFLALPSTKREITDVAGALLERGALTGDEVLTIVDGARSLAAT